jgi:DNA-binding FrmR family transcriptional regulator
MADSSFDSGKQMAKKRLLDRLSRVEGQLSAVRNLVETGAEPEKIAQQMSAARSAVDKAFYSMIASSMEFPADEHTQVKDLRGHTARMAELIRRFA